jgi:nucleotide-binding universal stress UspA family protein
MFDTVVLAIDGEEAEAALPTVRELANRFMSRIVIVHVSEMVVGRTPLPHQPDEPAIQERLAELVEDLRAEGLDVSLELHSATIGRAARIIADTARLQNAGLIVVSSRGHAPVVGVLTGSVTQKLLHLAPCPVLAIPAHTVAAVAA